MLPPHISLRCGLTLALVSGCGIAPSGEVEVAAAEPAPRSLDVASSAASGDRGTLLDAGSDEKGDAGSLYPQVVSIIERSCAYQRCHAGTPMGAGLGFELGSDHRAMLVDVPSCEYERMARVAPGSLEQSWLWIKLTAPFRPITDPYAHAIYFTPPPGWDESQRGCRDQTDEGVPLFGQRMPSTAPNTLPPEQLDVIRRWILAGAPP